MSFLSGNSLTNLSKIEFKRLTLIKAQSFILIYDSFPDSDIFLDPKETKNRNSNPIRSKTFSSQLEQFKGNLCTTRYTCAFTPPNLSQCVHNLYALVYPALNYYNSKLLIELSKYQYPPLAIAFVHDPTNLKLNNFSPSIVLFRCELPNPPLLLLRAPKSNLPSVTIDQSKPVPASSNSVSISTRK